MKLLAVVTFLGWRLHSYNSRMHWAVRRKANQPPLRSDDRKSYVATVATPHKRRTVEITRYGPREMDMDNLAASVKPALDLIKCRVFNGQDGTSSYMPGYIFDDSPKYCKLVVRQEKGPYSVTVKVFG